jgi:hypothetical protein
MVKKPVFWLSVLLATALVAPTSQAPKGNRALSRIAGPAKVKGSFGPAEAQVRSDPGFGVMPLAFIANEGQLAGNAAYYIKGRDKCVYFAAEGLTFVLGEPGAADSRRSRRGRIAGPTRGGGRELKTWTVKLDFVGANPSVRPVGDGRMEGVVSYFKGKPEDWKTGLPTYSRLVYSDLWPGIDLVYAGTVNELKYEFILEPGADPGLIRLAYRGARQVSIDESGRLEVRTPCGSFQDGEPVAYQDIDGRRVPVPVTFEPDGRVEGSFGFRFRIGEYDRSRPLILDPVVFVYCGFVGGDSDDGAYDIAVDLQGNIYIVGYTWSTESTFPVTVGPDLVPANGYDTFVAKLNAAGKSFVYCGYIGGDGYDDGEGIAVDNAGNAYVAGSTTSTQTTFPVMVGPDMTHNGSDDTYVAKVNATGTALLYCGYIGGSLEDWGYAIAVDGTGNAYVAGSTRSTQTTFPETVGPDLTHNGDFDAFVAKVNASGSALVYCGYIGGSAADGGFGIAVGSSGNAYVTGHTQSTQATFPETVGPDLTHNGSADAFVAKVNAGGTALVYCGYVGGASGEFGQEIALDSSENAYVAGDTLSPDTTFPVLVGPDLTYNGSWDGFITKVNAAGTALVYSGYVGGSDSDGCYSVAVDRSGNAFLTGYVDSDETTFPVLGGPDLTYNGDYDAFVAKVNSSGSALVYCGYIGGPGEDYGYGVAVDPAGSAYVAGYTTSTEPDFPVYIGPDLTQNDYDDAFVAKIVEEPLWKPRHAVGDFDGDGMQEAAVDFGGTGAWMYDSGAWSQLTAANPESLMAAEIDGDGVAEIIADLGFTGLWLWNAGAWNQLSAVNADCVAAGDVDADATDELVGDFGAAGLWLYNGGFWTQLSGVNADYVAIADLDGTGGEEIIGDFGAVGLWLWSAGAWSQLSGVNADYMMFGNTNGVAGEEMAGDFGATGLWLWGGGAWSQLSGVNADFAIAVDVDGSGDDEILGDFAATGLWLWDSGIWTQLSNINPDFMIGADTDGDGAGEVVGDFGALGLWLVDAGVWTPISGVNPEYMFSGDFDGDNADEIMADFGTLGLWLWNGGAWSQVSGGNPE